MTLANIRASGGEALSNSSFNLSTKPGITVVPPATTTELNKSGLISCGRKAGIVHNKSIMSGFVLKRHIMGPRIVRTSYSEIFRSGSPSKAEDGDTRWKHNSSRGRSHASRLTSFEGCASCFPSLSVSEYHSGERKSWYPPDAGQLSLCFLVCRIFRVLAWAWEPIV